MVSGWAAFSLNYSTLNWNIPHSKCQVYAVIIVQWLFHLVHGYKLWLIYPTRDLVWNNLIRVKFPPWSENKEFKKVRLLLRPKRHIKIELCVKLSVLRWFLVGNVVQNRRSALSLAWHGWVSCKGKEWKIYCRGELALSSDPQIWKFHVVVWQATSKHCTKKRAARAARLFFNLFDTKF